MLRNEIKRILGKVEFIYKYQNLFFLLLYNFIIVFIIIMFCQPVYETSDDFAIGLISTGVYGEEYKQYLVFSNVIYGFLLKFLSNIILINWYIVLQYIIVAFSYSILFYLLYKKSCLGAALFFNMLAWCFVGYEEIRLIQFTRTASIVCIVGLILLVYGIINSSFKSIFVGFVMSLIGSFIRIECFWICLAYIIAFSAAYVVHNRKEINHSKKMIKMIFIIVFSVTICSIIDKAYYSADKGWKEYREYNTVRSYLLDLGVPSWEENQDKYESIGFSQNDVIVLSQWIFNDSNKYTLENMNEIASWRTEKKIDVSFVRDFFKGLCGNLYNSIFYIAWIFSLIILLSTRTKGGRVLSFLNFIGTIAIYFYLYYIGRIVARVEFGIWISAILINFFAYFEFNKREKMSSSNGYSKLSIILGTVLFLNVKIIAFDAPPIYENSTRDFLSYLAENTQNLYVLDVRSFNGACFSFRPYKKADSFYMSNYCFSGEWGTFSPFSKEHNKKLGFDNPIEDLCTKDNVYYVANQDISFLLTYLQENYNVSSVELVETYNEYNIYKFYIVS